MSICANELTLLCANVHKYACTLPQSARPACHRAGQRHKATGALIASGAACPPLLLTLLKAHRLSLTAVGQVGAINFTPRCHRPIMALAGLATVVTHRADQQQRAVFLTALRWMLAMTAIWDQSGGAPQTRSGREAYSLSLQKTIRKPNFVRSTPSVRDSPKYSSGFPPLKLSAY